MWQALVCCAFKGTLNFAEEKRPSSSLPNQTYKSFLPLLGFSCPTHVFTHQMRASDAVSHWSVPYWVEQSPSKQLQDVWALSVHEVPWGNSPAHLILPLSIYQLAAASKAVNSSLLPTTCSFVGSPFHGAAPIFSISYFSFWVQLFGKGAFFF